MTIAPKSRELRGKEIAENGGSIGVSEGIALTNTDA